MGTWAPGRTRPTFFDAGPPLPCPAYPPGSADIATAIELEPHQPPGNGTDEHAVSDDLEDFLTPTRRFVRWVLPILGVVVAVAMVLPFASGLIDAWLFDRAGDRVQEQLAEGDADAVLAEAVLLVRAVGCDTARASSGTAFTAQVGDDPVLLTNRHVAEGAASVGLQTLSGGPGPRVASWRLSASADLAVLELEDAGELPATLPLADDLPARGERVRTVGFPSARPFTSTGTVAEVAPDRLRLALRIDPGASGSPVVGEAGRVIGQVFGVTGDGLGVATSVPALRDGLADLGPVVEGCG